MTLPRPAHLYIHIPFCVRACDYCAFYKRVGTDPIERRTFMQALAAEAAVRLPLCEPLQSIYIGGGTPSFLSVEEWAELLEILHRHATLAPGCEFTTEANPVSMSADKLRLLRQGGVNRISLGLQSFSPELRQRIGRAGSAERIHQLVELLREHDFLSIGCDLIYAIPGQTLAQWEDDLRRVLELRPDHISAYSLMLEPGTPLARRMDREADDDSVVAMWHRTDELLAAGGLLRYEVSNLARPGHACRHNEAVWRGSTFIGLGPSASWYDGNARYTNVADLGRWSAGEAPERDWLPPDRRAVEILATGLRHVDGWTRSSFQEHAGFDYLQLRGETLRNLAKQGIVVLDEDTLRLTRDGMLLADYVARELY